MKTKNPALFLLMAFSLIALVVSGCYTVVMPPPEMYSGDDYENEEYTDEEYEDAGDLHFYNYGHNYSQSRWGHNYYDPFDHWYYDPYYRPFGLSLNFGYRYNPFLYSSYSYYSPFGFYGGQPYGYSGFLGYPYYIGGYYPNYASAVTVQKKRNFNKRGSYTGSRVVTRRIGSAQGSSSVVSSVLSKSVTSSKARGESRTTKRSVTRSTSKNRKSSVSNNSRRTRTKTVTRSRSSSSGSSKSSARRSITRRSTSRSSSKGSTSSGKRSVSRRSAKRNSNHYLNVSYGQQPSTSTHGRKTSPGFARLNRQASRAGHEARPSYSRSSGRSPAGKSDRSSRQVVKK